MPAGDFSASVLLEIKLKAEQNWADSQLSQSFKADAEAAIALKTNSRARFSQLTDPEHENSVRITFLNPCAIVAEDCVSNCDIDEPELESGSKVYALDLCKKTGFSVNAFKNRTNTYTVEEEAAIGLNQSIKALDEWWSLQSLVKLKQFAGVNVDPLPYTYAGGTTVVPAAQYGAQMIPDMMYDAMQNKMQSPFYINRGDLWVEWIRVQQNAGNLDGKGDLERIRQLRMYFDSASFGAAGLTESTFAVSSTAVAFVTKTKNPTSPTLIAGTVQQTRYTIPSPIIPGVSYDVFYSLKCKTDANGKENIFHSWRLETNGGIFLNPEGCSLTRNGNTVTPTGVLSYTKGA